MRRLSSFSHVYAKQALPQVAAQLQAVMQHNSKKARQTCSKAHREAVKRAAQSGEKPQQAQGPRK